MRRSGQEKFVGMGDGGEVGLAAAVAKKNVVGSKPGCMPDGEGFCNVFGAAVVEEKKKRVGLVAGDGWLLSGASARMINFVMRGEGEGLMPIGEALLREGNGNKGVVEAKEVDPPAPR